MDRRAAFAALLLLTAACGTETEAPATETAPEEVPWIVTAAHPLAVDAGAEILEAGGSAVDAAVAVQAVLGLVEPQSSGLGGGAFMLFYDASTDDLIAYDGREIAPASVRPDVFIKEDGEPMTFFEAVTSGFAVGVPGAVAMLDMAHAEHGRLEWNRLFRNAERLARDGFAMPERLNSSLRRVAPLREDPSAAIYLDADGAVMPVGSIVQNTDYADTVAAIAEGGAAAFYTGSIADAIVTRVNDKTGETTITREDFASYRPITRQPVCAEVALKRVCSMPPPSSGGVTLLQIAQLFERAAPDQSPTQALVPYIEATRLAYADRGRFLGDPTAMGTERLSTQDLTAALIGNDYMNERAKLIGTEPAETVGPGDPDGLLIREGRIDDQSYEVPSTSHFSIRDRVGNIVSMTTTVESVFGSQMMAAGMVLNNQLTDFSRVPGRTNQVVVNEPGPGKRPMSSMSPSIIFDEDGRPYAAIGSPGGSAIIGYVAKPLLAHLMTGQRLSDAVREPHVVAPRGSVVVEEGADGLETEIEALGYDVRQYPLASGLYGFVLEEDGVDLVIDPRREGSARVESAQ